MQLYFRLYINVYVRIHAITQLSVSHFCILTVLVVDSLLEYTIDPRLYICLAFCTGSGLHF